MNTPDKAKIRKIMDRMRRGRLTGNPQPVSSIFRDLGVFASGLDKIAMMMQEYANQNNIEGMYDPDAYDRVVAGAQLGMKLGGLAGAKFMSRLVSEHYRYTVHPALRSLGKAGGKYGQILENYITAKSDLKKSWGDIGANVGQVAAIGLGFAARALMATSIAAAATGIGIPIALVGIAVSLAVETASSFILPWVGRKIGETIAEKGGYMEKYSIPTLGKDILDTMPAGIQHYQSVYSSIQGQDWFKGGYESYFSKMDDIANRDSGGISMRELGISTRETGSLYSAVSTGISAPKEQRGNLTSKLGVLKSVTGEDFMDTFSEISQGVAKSKTGIVSSDEINKTADAFTVFFAALSKGASSTNKAGLGLIKDLAKSANAYAKQNMNVKNVDTLFAGMQTFVQSTMQVEGKQDTSEATNVVGILDKVAKSTGASPMASGIANFAGLSLAESKRGLDADGITKMSQAFSARYDFGGDSSIDTEKGGMNLGTKGKTAYAQMYLDFTKTQQQGGLGLSADETNRLIKYTLAYQTNPDKLKFDKVAAGIDNPLADTANAMKLETFVKISKIQTDITNNYEKLTSTFAGSYTELSTSILTFSANITEQIAIGALDLLKTTKDLIEQSMGEGASAPSVHAGTYAGTAATTAIVGYSGAKVAAGKKLIETDKMLIAQAGFTEEISPAAAKAGIDVKSLYAFFAAESRFGNNMENYRNMNYVGVGQIGLDAQTDVVKEFGPLNRDIRSENIQIAAYYMMQIRRNLRALKAKYPNLRFDPDDPVVIYAAYNRGQYGLMEHIRKTGRFDENDYDGTETETGINAARRAQAGFDASQGTPIYAAPSIEPTSISRPGTAKAAPMKTVSNYKGGIWKYVAEERYSGKFSANVTLLNMSGITTLTGSKTADYMRRLYTKSGNSQAFYQMCAAIANNALASVNSRLVSRSGTADADLAFWKNNFDGAVMSYDEASKLGFQPGDLLYVQGGNHVGVVDYDGTVLQAGTAYDHVRKTNMLRTDITSFTYEGGLSGVIVIRPGADANLDGRITAEESANMRNNFGKAAIPKDASMKKVNKTLKGKEVLVNAVVEGAKGNFAVKTAKGSGLSKGQIAKIKAKESAIEKALGLEADQLSFDTKQIGSGSVLNIHINVPLDNVGKVAQDIIKIIERII